MALTHIWELLADSAIFKLYRMESPGDIIMLEELLSIGSSLFNGAGKIGDDRRSHKSTKIGKRMPGIVTILQNSETLSMGMKIVYNALSIAEQMDCCIYPVLDAFFAIGPVFLAASAQ